MAIGVGELSYMSRQVDTEMFKTLQTFGTATVFYLHISSECRNLRSSPISSITA
ncbi:polar amino acid ABC transporter inner membrane subunit [Caballeronia arationis]|jgi:ABC-type amino acid transport system permease subunit|nr:polar amino acid ABC transporter inner membrane subunit [Caballeronia arationis]